MPHFAVSDLVLHCLPMSHKKDTRLIWVKTGFIVTVVSTLMNCLTEMVQLSPHNIGFG